jgi:hypothetical protein
MKDLRKFIKTTIREFILEQELNENKVNIVLDIFNNFNNLSKYGTVENYLEYLSDIFPNSKVNEIVYHGGTLNPTDRGKDSFTGELGGKHGIYFTGSKSRAKSYIKSGDNSYKSNSKIYFALLNIERPLDKKIWSKWKFGADTITDDGLKQMKEHNSDGIIDTDLLSKYTKIKYNTQYVVLEMKQVHILGSDKDIDGFKKYMNK